MGEKKSSTCSLSESSTDSSEILDEESCGLQIGCGKCASRRLPIRFLNCCNTAKGMLIFLCIAVFIQGMVVNGLTNIVISTLEKRFHLRSSETGLVAGCYDLGFLLAVIVVTYVGGRGHKPQWIGWGVFIMGLGSITFALPHFVAPQYSISTIQTRLCDENMSQQQCGETHLRVYRGFFILAQLLHGIGACGMYTLGITYLDANVKECVSSIYHGIFFAFSLAGPGVGFLLGGYFVKLYTNLGETVSVDQTSPLWVGNWWIGYLMCGVLAIIVSLPIIMYPENLPNTSIYREDREQEMDQNPDAIRAKNDNNFGRSFKDIPGSLLVVLRNVTLVCLSIAGAMDSGTLIALATFGPKYAEAMFRLTASEAGIYFGLASILSACTAHIAGGILVSKLKLRVKVMLKICIACAVLALGTLFVFLLQCEDPRVPGVTMPHNGESSFRCDGTCGCNTTLYDPVCGGDGLTYVSFCEAGCTKTSEEEYVNCSRVFASDNITSWASSTATSGKCDVDNCPSVAIVLTFGALAVFFTFLKFQPALQVSLRTVPFNQRSFAIGMQWTIMRCFGLIPLPIILGNALDSSCMVWGSLCGDCGSCKLYHNASMAKYMTIIFTVAKGISITSLIIAYLTYKPPPTDEAEMHVTGQSDRDTSLAESFSETRDSGVNLTSYVHKSTGTYDNAAFVE